MMEKERLTIRKATEQDKEFAYQVKKAAYQDVVVQVYGWDEDVQRQYHEKQFSTQNLSVKQIDDTDIGILKLVKEQDHFNFSQIFILPEYQDLGIGTECILMMVKKADALKLPVRLQVFKVNTRAQNLYERLGFIPVRKTENHILMKRPCR